MPRMFFSYVFGRPYKLSLPFQTHSKTVCSFNRLGRWGGLCDLYRLKRAGFYYKFDYNCTTKVKVGSGRLALRRTRRGKHADFHLSCCFARSGPTPGQTLRFAVFNPERRQWTRKRKLYHPPFCPASSASSIFKHADLEAAGEPGHLQARADVQVAFIDSSVSDLNRHYANSALSRKRAPK